MGRIRDMAQSAKSINTTSNRPANPHPGQKHYDTTLQQMLNYTLGGWVPVNIAPPTPSLSGGTLTSDSTYYYRTFTSTSSLVVSNSGVTADILMVAGGGGGGGYFYLNGGGGAGGLIYSTSSLITAGTYSVTVGSGGAINVQGNNSIFNGLTAIGGGRGTGYISNGSDATIGIDGGSGGGGGAYETSFNNFTAGHLHGFGTPGQGNDGDGGAAGNPQFSGGGGGAGAAASGIAGGNGLSFPDFASATSTGDRNYYAGGGSGVGWNSQANPGIGGGGYGNAWNGSANGMTNTGGGGGGDSPWNYQYTSGTGGSGIVIVRYTRAQVGG